jgi:hypothetical protein
MLSVHVKSVIYAKLQPNIEKCQQILVESPNRKFYENTPRNLSSWFMHPDRETDGAILIAAPQGFLRIYFYRFINDAFGMETVYRRTVG